MYGPVSSFSQSVISQLGRLAKELTVEELSSLRLTERRSIAALGAVSDLSNRQVAASATADKTLLNLTVLLVLTAAHFDIFVLPYKKLIFTNVYFQCVQCALFNSH